MRQHIISDDAFAHMVSQEVKNKASDEERDFLSDPSNVDRWLRALGALLSHLDEQISSAEEDMEADIARYERLGEDGIGVSAESRHYYEQKISKIKKFRFYVVRKISDVESIKKKYGSSHADEEKGIIMCRDAIVAHMQYLREYDIETTPADEALYLALEGVWAFDKIEKPEEEFVTQKKIEKN